MSESALAREFLDIVAELEAVLRDQGAPDARGLGEAVHTLDGRHSLVRRHRSELLAFAALRNAIAHNRYQAGRPIPACQGELRPVVHSKSASAGRDQERPR